MKDLSVVQFTPPALDQSLYSAFLQDEVMLAETLHLTVGTKIEHNDYTGFECRAQHPAPVERGASGNCYGPPYLGRYELPLATTEIWKWSPAWSTPLLPINFRRIT